MTTIIKSKDYITKSIPVKIKNTLNYGNEYFNALLRQRIYKGRNEMELLMPAFAKKNYVSPAMPIVEKMEVTASTIIPKHLGEIDQWSNKTILRAIKHLKSISPYEEYSHAKAYNKFADKLAAQNNYGSDITLTNLPIN